MLPQDTFNKPEAPRLKQENRELLSFLCAMQGDGGPGLDTMPFEPKSIPICINMGALACISNDHTHFISLNTVQQMTINGIGNGLEVKGIGTA